ncbi:MAG: TetR/AcrR family transcriptional regulator C-terminal domain-containing protein [Lachnospiraceae bacterium]|nr:TetR/AcrR family transcriptional regulator C-terminal domain-containing protein [Lachnospiraceae bacterium]
MNTKNPDTARQLADSLKELMKTKSLDKIKIKEITDGAGLMRPTFYNHFQDKYEVVEYIFCTEILEPTLPFIAQGLMKEAVLYMFTAIYRDYEFYCKEVNRTGQNSFQEIITNSFHRYITPYLSDRVREPVHQMIRLDHVTEYYANLFHFILSKWLNEKEMIPVSQLMEIYSILVSEPLEKLLQYDTKKDDLSN